MSVKGGLANAQVQFTETPSTGLFAGTSQSYPNLRIQSTFSPGVLADQCDGIAFLPLAFAASTPQTIDLNALVDFYTGATLTVARVPFIAFKNLSQLDNDFFTVGDAVTNEWDGFLSAAGTMLVYPSSPGAANDGFTVISAPGLTAMPAGVSTYNLKINPGTLAKSLIVVIGTRSV
jgi:hypothetical protein